MFYYRKFLPAIPLRPHISTYYILEYQGGKGEQYALSAIANRAYGMVFNYGDPYKISNPNYADELLPLNFLSGVSTAPYKLNYSGRIGSLGVVFQSPAFRDSFHLPDLEEFMDKRIDASLFLGNKLTSFTDALFHAPTPERKIELANTFFLKQFASKLGNLAITDRIIHTILDHKGFLSMDGLAKQYSISPRHLRRIFKAETGISPKYYARLKRFEYTWLCANSGKFNWREFTGAHGFYDQAHLIREFKSFSGITPGKNLFDSNSIKYLEEQ